MVKMEYCQNGNEVNDFFLEDEVDKINEHIYLKGNITLRYANKNIFYRILEEVALRRMRQKDICFIFNGEEISINEEMLRKRKY